MVDFELVIDLARAWATLSMDKQNVLLTTADHVSTARHIEKSDNEGVL